MERFRFKYVPRYANWVVNCSTLRAQLSLKQSSPIKVLVDNNVFAHGVTHETTWIATGMSEMFPGQELGYAARIPIHAENDESDDYEDIQYLAGIAHLARLGFVRLMTSTELFAEKDLQPIGRYRGYGYFDYNIFENIEIQSVDGYHLPDFRDQEFFRNNPTINKVVYFNDIDPFDMHGNSKKDQQARLKKSTCSLYKGLVALLGRKNNLDAWHIRTAESHGMFCFLTMDRKLLVNFRQKKNKTPISSLQTQLLTPAELGCYLRLLRISPTILSYNDASFFVRSDLCSPDSKRRRPNSD